MFWIADGRCACYCSWRRPAERTRSGQNTLLHSPPHTARILHCPPFQACHSQCPVASKSLSRCAWQAARVYTDGDTLRAGDPLWWPQEDSQLLTGTRLGAAAEHHAKNVRQLGAWRQQLCDIQAELGGPDILHVILNAPSSVLASPPVHVCGMP
jgi:hypothetical protein